MLLDHRDWLLGHFRDQMIAAPLKQQRFGERPLRAVHFRDQMIAAPLKREEADAALLAKIRISAIR